MWDRMARVCVRTLEVGIVVSLAIMALLVFANVVLRYAFDTGIAQSEELARLMFVWLIFLGSILASAQRLHIGFDGLAEKLPLPLRKLLVLITGVLMLCACGMFVIGGYEQMRINWDNSYPVLGISYAWLYGVAVVFGLGLTVPIVHNVCSTLRSGPPATGLTQDLGDRINAKVPDVATGKEHDA